MVNNSTLTRAFRDKKDEFYTQLSDIEEELENYKRHFQGKVVLCNCGDSYESNFFRYFVMNFNSLGLKKLIATSYNSSLTPIECIGSDSFPGREAVGGYAYKIEISEVDPDQATDVEVILSDPKNTLTLLCGNGDFRSDECVEILKEANIVCTNPPFSLFREYIAQLIEYEKNFLIIGNQNAITYKEVFPLIKANKMWLGEGFRSNTAFFRSPYEDRAITPQHKDGMIRVSGVMWFTNMDYPERHRDIELYRTYTPDQYPTYDNYDAINVDRTADIPHDYYGVMGVPITFLDKYNPNQFEIIGFRKGNDDKDLSINGRFPYFRILIKRKDFPTPTQKDAPTMCDALSGEFENCR